MPDPGVRHHTSEEQEILDKGLESVVTATSKQEIIEMEKKLRALEKENKALGKKHKAEKKSKIDAQSRMRDAEKESRREISHRSKEIELREKSKNIFSKAWDKIKKAFEYVYGKVKDGVRWIVDKIKEHPILTIVVLLVAAGIWYYTGPLTKGYSAVFEEGSKIVAETARSTMDVGSVHGVNEILPTL